MNPPAPIGLKEIRAAATRLKGVLLRTDAIPSPAFSQLCGARVWLKPENLQVTGTYKIRGAFNKIALLDDTQKRRGLIASSAGNHAQGVAYAAQRAGVPATIVMPTTAPLVKVQATREYGVEVVLYGNYYDEAEAEARRLEVERGLTFIHPFDDWDIIAGQGTVGLEILDDCPSANTLLLPVGGGGLISGVALAVKALRPEVRILGVEPEGASSMARSLAAGKLSPLAHVHTIADGVAVGTPGAKPFSVVKDLVDGIVQVSDDEIMEAFLLVLEKHKLVAEPAGAVSLAALLSDRFQLKGQAVAVLSGGNIDVVTMAALIERGLIKMGRVFEFSVDLPDRPGQLLNVARVLANCNANVIQIEHNQFQNIERFTQVRLTVKVETAGHAHIAEVTAALAAEGYPLVAR